MLKTIVTFSALILSLSLKGQSIDSVSTTAISNPPSINVPTSKPTPGRIALYSALIPGAGQFYNKSYVKMPFIYAGIGSLIYIIDRNRTRYKCFEYAHRLSLLDIEPADNILNCRGLAINLENFSEAGLKTRRDNFRKNMELAYIGLSLFYIANIIDAYVDAHLNTFDINEDLSFRIAPYINPDLYQSSIGLTLTFRNK